MIEPFRPSNEILRQTAVDSFNILDTPAEDIFDSLTELVAQIAEAPICLVALLDRDRNWLKSHFGIPFNESPRAISFCGHTINENGDFMVVEDARIDDRFHDNPLVTELGAVFYAGVPLVSSDGLRVGTICIYDKHPRSLGAEAQKALINIGKQVEALLESRRQNRLLTHTSRLLQLRNKELAEFARSVVHDLKSPMSNIVTMADLVDAESTDTISDDSRKWLLKLKSTTKAMASYIDDLLNLYTDDRVSSGEIDTVQLQSFIEELCDLVGNQNDVEIVLDSKLEAITVNHSLLMQIVMNLVLNSIKYCDKDVPVLVLSVIEQKMLYQITLQDNGQGIPDEYIDTLFELYDRGNLEKEGTNARGKGIGLNRVRSLVRRGGGEVSVKSTVGVGTSVTFTLAKTV